MGRKAGLVPSGINRAIGQAPGIIKPAEQQTRTTHRVVGPAMMGDDSSLRLTLEQLLALPDQLSPRRLADLRQRPGGGGDRPGKLEISDLKRRNPLSICEHAFAQSPLRR